MKFIKHTKIWFTFSLIVILIGVGAMVRNKMDDQIDSALIYGVDFTGGAVLVLDFDEAAVDTGSSDFKTQLGNAFVSELSDKSLEIRQTSEGYFSLRTQVLTDEERDAVVESIGGNVGAFELISYNTIGPKVGETLKSRALFALIIALIAIVLYIAYAFRKVPKKVSAWKFGFAAIVALAHDVIITLGVFALFQFEINAYFITALLTIMGFSVHDTIVVFDRIRENLHHQGREDTFGDIADESLNQTMTRSINTSISTLFPLLALYIWGSTAIEHFVLALIIGILVGTYSSIFIASPVLTLWQERGRKR